VFAEALAILVMLGVLSILIIVHEFGHFSVARIFGFQTPVFGFGLPFGPYWVVGHRWGTEFRIHACVLGGYVAIPELGDETNAREENYGVPLKPFRKFPIWQRALVAFAGVGMNIWFAWLIMFVMLLTMGEPTYSTSVRELPADNPIAAKAGVLVGDKITAIDDTKMTTSDEIVKYLTHRPDTTVTLHIERDSKPTDVKVTTNDSGRVGMSLQSKATYTPAKGNIFEIGLDAADRNWKLTLSMLDALGQMFQGIFHIAKPAAGHPALGIGDLHGVLFVVVFGADIVQQNLSQILLFTIMISLDLAIINLVPWPALDGGHLAFMAFEAVRGRPMHEKAQGEIVKWGFLSLLLLMALIMFNDVNALMTGQIAKLRSGKDIKTPGDEKDKAAPKDQQAPPGKDNKDGQPGDKTSAPVAPSSSAVPSKSTAGAQESGSGQGITKVEPATPDAKSTPPKP
jgi:regulator of sigma E protease